VRKISEEGILWSFVLVKKSEIRVKFGNNFTVWGKCQWIWNTMRTAISNQTFCLW